MWSFAKGHGTLNDFVVITDLDGTLNPTDQEVRFLCDRRAGIGGDGLLRAVKARHIPGWTGDPELWFMDYRNADASIAEMCGNGLRVFVRHLVAEGLAQGPTLTVATRAGLRTGHLLPDGRIKVSMGQVRVDRTGVRIGVPGKSWRATPVDVGNPHAVSLLMPGESLRDLDLTCAPTWEPAERFPQGVNAEFVEVLGENRLRMRVYERGSGETWSCGTGTVAVAATMAATQGVTQASYEVEVPGGVLQVDLADGEAWLTGPAVIVVRGTVDVRLVASASGSESVSVGRS